MHNPLFSLNEVSKVYENINREKSQALSNITISLLGNNITCIMGNSGSGKTTLLRTIAKLETATSGTIDFNYDSDKLGYVFQNNSVFPWMTVAENIGYAMKIRRIEKENIDEKVKLLVDMVNLPQTHLNKYPKELSGGELRRLAIASALSKDTQLLLLDEPTSQLDDMNKWSIQDLVQRIWASKKMAVLWVTHDIEEAIYMSNQVIIMKKGQIVENVPVELTYPRTNEMRVSPRFLALKLKISELLC
ncbi:ABC transporter ATP-binding protein [Mucilaginibacter sp. PPCGB 2223]|uniref:ABC transporter ATP-binding protein n=1 Tax=Mucilaginibacter sp. PPCGB 2223 TaxID=1886027 RepID=UPI001111B5E1|nr:ATP-binding cassette domain-containing protein [Mucilaginibacter sp. PPCGB 2223]